MMLKDSEMFRKWLEYKFNIPRFRAAEGRKIKHDKFAPFELFIFSCSYKCIE